MKVIWEFDLRDEDDKSAHVCLQKAYQFQAALSQIVAELRSKSKYSEEQATTWDAVYELVWQKLQDNNLGLDDL